MQSKWQIRSPKFYKEIGRQPSKKRISQSKRLVYTDSVNFANPGQDYTETDVKTAPILGAYLLQPQLGTHSEGSSTQWQSKLLDDAPG